MDYKQKYLKYKQKYLTLKQKGGYIPDLNTLNEFEKYISEGSMIKYEIRFDKDVDIKDFFSKTLDRKYLVPDNFDNFIGITDYNIEDLNKIWKYFKDPIINNQIYSLDNGIFLNDFKINKFLKINRLSEDKIKQIFNLFKKILNNSKRGDKTQLSGYKTFNEPTYFENNGIIERINSYKSSNLQNDLVGNFVYENITYQYKYYHDKNILYIYTIDNNDIKLYMFNVKKEGNIYKIFPFSYSNLLLNLKYEEAIKNVFETIRDKLNQITRSEKYVILPDGFFHIHVTKPERQERYVLLTLHALYEIENHGPDITYNYKTSNGQIISRIRKDEQTLSMNKDAIRKEHSFYVLYDLESSNHYLYQINDSDKINKFFGLQKSLGIEERLLGNNVFDLNHIEGKGVILTTLFKKCDFLCYPECPGGQNCIQITIDGINYWFNREDSNYVFINNNTDKCANISIKENITGTNTPLKNIFINDIRVHNQFKLCTTPLNIIDKGIIAFANLQSPPITKITLDDASFIQFPKIYENNTEASYIWSVVYTKARFPVRGGDRLDISGAGNKNAIDNNMDYIFQPIKHSIYSARQNYELIHMKYDNDNENSNFPIAMIDTLNPDIIEIETFLDFITVYYNTYISNYDLLGKINDLTFEKRKGFNNQSSPNYDEFIRKQNEFDTEYTRYHDYIKYLLYIFLILKFDTINELGKFNILEDKMFITIKQDDGTHIVDTIQVEKNYIINTVEDNFIIKYFENPKYLMHITKGGDNYLYTKYIEDCKNATLDIKSLHNFFELKNMNSYIKTIAQ